MATQPDVISNVDITLRAIAAEVDDLPSRERDWHQESSDNRMAFSLEWKELMDRLSILGAAHRDGGMSPRQQLTYRQTVRKLKQALPIVDRLSLYQPPLPRDV